MSRDVESALLAEAAEDLYNELLKSGMPVTVDNATPAIFKIAGFHGDSTTASIKDLLPFIAKLNDLIPRVIDKFAAEDDLLGAAAKFMFGLAPGSRGMPITRRRALARKSLHLSHNTSIDKHCIKICGIVAFRLYVAALG